MPSFNLPRPITFSSCNVLLGSAAKSVCEDSMLEAAQDCLQENYGSKDITAILYGSWQRRGHLSLKGVVTARRHLLQTQENLLMSE